MPASGYRDVFQARSVWIVIALIASTPRSRFLFSRWLKPFRPLTLRR